MTTRRRRCSQRSRKTSIAWAGCFSIRRRRAICWRRCGQRSPTPRSCARRCRRSQAIATLPCQRAAGSGGCRFRDRPRLLRGRRDRLGAAQGSDLRVNAVAYLAQHLIVLLDPADIVVNLHHAYRRPEFRDGHYACFHTGPSATADIEGVLIHGAQGVRSLSVLPLARHGRRQSPWRLKADSGVSFTELSERLENVNDLLPIPAPANAASTFCTTPDSINPPPLPRPSGKRWGWSVWFPM